MTRPALALYLARMVALAADCGQVHKGMSEAEIDGLADRIGRTLEKAETEPDCRAIEDIGEHVFGSFVIEPGTLAIVDIACLFCGTTKMEASSDAP
jgi:hypothetical protein